MAVYESMKDSGIEWMGLIPSHWNIERAKFNFTQTNNRGNTTQVLLAASQKYGMCPQNMLEGVVKVAESTDLQQFKTVHINDFVISLRSFQGGFERSDYEGVCSPAYQVFSAHKSVYNVNYLKHLFKSEMFIDEMNSLTVGIREGKNIKYEDFANSLLFVPPLNEQTAIAAYLDDQCAKIDTLISEAKASIEEYKKWKASLIFEAVTKGLDPNVEMKDSGVEWIGKIPATWRKNTLYQLVTQVKNKNTDMQENNLLSLSYGKIKRRDINARGGLLPESFNGYNIIEKNDIVLRLTDLQNDHTSLRVGLATERGIITSAYTVLRPDNPDFAPYLYYLLHAFDIKKGFYGMGSGVRQGLNYDEVKELKVVIPPIKEQKAIIQYLGKKTEKIDFMISEKQNIIGELDKYKKSLVYETVTGKRKVV